MKRNEEAKKVRRPQQSAMIQAFAKCKRAEFGNENTAFVGLKMEKMTKKSVDLLTKNEKIGVKT